MPRTLLQKHRLIRQDPSRRLSRAVRLTTADTNIATDELFGDADARSKPVAFAFSLLRTGAAAGLIFEFGSATRGGAVYVSSGTLVVVAGAGTGSADDGVTLSIANALPLAVRASATLTLSANLTNGATVTIGSKTYTFQTVLTNVDGNVLIGATASDTIDNLIAAINADAGAGTLYAAATVIHADVSAAAGAGDTMTATAKAWGDGANAITVSSSVVGVWGNPSLRGGSAPIKFVVKINPGTGQVKVWRKGIVIGQAVAVNAGFGGAWTDDAAGAVGNVQGAANDRVPGGSQVALANCQLVNGVDVYLRQYVF